MERATQAVSSAVEALASGGLVVVADDHDRENEGDLIGAAALMSTDTVAFMVRHTTGILCAPMPAARARDLRLGDMVPSNTDPHGTAFTITVDHDSCGTGVSAQDRALTLRALADPAAGAADFTRPGHIFPLKAREGGVLTRRGHTEAAVDLLCRTDLPPVAVISEIVDEDGGMARGETLKRFAAQHGLPFLTIADLVTVRDAERAEVQRVASAALPTVFGAFQATAYRTSDGGEHLAIVLGDVAAQGASDDGVLVRVHSECLTGDIIGSLRCDCGAQLEHALAAIAREGCGAIIYLRGHEGRGIGLANKITAYSLQDDGLDTVDANVAQGLPVDGRDYGHAASILADLGVHNVRLISNNPAKSIALRAHGLFVAEHVRVPYAENPYNVRYLRAKENRMGHQKFDTVAM
ncbi:MAG: GTP cyclohydrolase II [Pseudonocardiaceae bacterium]|nr:MAG: GTP cyclohydrolase II [Pseudonocardiaceae bacterium]